MPVRPLPSLRLSIQSRCTAAAVAAVHLQTYRYCTATILSRSWPSAQCRWSSHSHSPTSPTAKPSRKKVTINTLRNLYTNKTPIAVVTAHDFPSGLIADLAGVDVVLVGDSLAMVALGMEVSFEIYR
jgi:3-methyl-2-oxobutanoate hydroxymethyltransferase